ncbi:hypothetical protein [Nocardia sp. NPDC058497]|uniref:hypothetical protein n=1 Tax=Nocardia sp. NPDC058497 TaxID=3346529 RepID=UPI0036540B71
MKKSVMRAAVAAAAITPMVVFASGVASAEPAPSPGVNLVVADEQLAGAPVGIVTSATPWVTPVHACGGPGILGLSTTVFHGTVPVLGHFASESDATTREPVSPFGSPGHVVDDSGDQVTIRRAGSSD